MSKTLLIFFSLIVTLLMQAANAQDSLTISKGDSATTDSVRADAVAMKYAQKCAGCHTIGGGKLTGPDLLPTRVWPKAELSAKVKLMEARVGPMTDDEVNSLVALLQDARAGERVTIAQELASKAVAATLEPASKNIGQKLFVGEQPLTNGGIACITCHRTGARGGTLGPDLTLLHQRMGMVAMISAIQQSQYRVMTGTYQKHPITAQEAVHLAEYLSATDHMPVASMESSVSAVGFVAGIAALFGIVRLYRKRPHHNGVRTRGMA